MGGQCVGGGLGVGEVGPAPIAEKSVGKFVGNDVEREITRAVRQARFEDHAAAAITAGGGAGQPDVATLRGYEVIEGDSKPRILQKIDLDLARE